MFVPAIKGQGTEEQQQKWLPLAYKMQIIGCYAQTELGHGSNVQGLETTATFDPQTDEFVLHSPTLTSSKVLRSDILFVCIVDYELCCFEIWSYRSFLFFTFYLLGMLVTDSIAWVLWSMSSSLSLIYAVYSFLLYHLIVVAWRTW